MKFVETRDGNLCFQLRRAEQEIFREILALYPLVPAAHFQVSKSGLGGKTDAAQQLLVEALAERQRESKRHVAAWIDDPQRFVKLAQVPGYRLTVAVAETDWLLQVLNDIRVGNWLQLGSPDPDTEEKTQLNEKNSRHYWAMELCGAFEMLLLRALDQAA